MFRGTPAWRPSWDTGPEPGSASRSTTTVVERDLRLVARSVGVEAWWWAGETGADLGVDAWVGWAEEWANDLAGASGPDGLTLREHADRRLAGWRLSGR